MGGCVFWRMCSPKVELVENIYVKSDRNWKTRRNPRFWGFLLVLLTSSSLGFETHPFFYTSSGPRLMESFRRIGVTRAEAITLKTMAGRIAESIIPAAMPF